MMRGRHRRGQQGPLPHYHRHPFFRRPFFAFFGQRARRYRRWRISALSVLGWRARRPPFYAKTGKKGPSAAAPIKKHTLAPCAMPLEQPTWHTIWAAASSTTTTISFFFSVRAQTQTEQGEAKSERGTGDKRKNKKNTDDDEESARGKTKETKGSCFLCRNRRARAWLPRQFPTSSHRTHHQCVLLF